METTQLRKLSDTDLLTATKNEAAAERRITLSVLRHLQEVNRRRLYALHHPSLWEYCIKELGYSEPAASRRINAMRLLDAVPEVAAKMDRGEISVTTAAKMQSFFRAAHKIENRTFSKAEKLELVQEAQSKTSREQDHLLAAIAPKAAAQKSERVLDAENTELRIVADKELMTLLTHVKERYAHKLNGKSDYASLLKLMAEIALTAKEPVQVKTETVPYSAESAPKSTRYIPEKLKNEIWLRDGGRCTYKIPNTNRTCDSRFALQLDHIQPLTLGGLTTKENLRLVCRTHNLWFAQSILGPLNLFSLP